MASVGSILGGAFRLFGERPGAILVWAGVNLLGSVAVAVGMSFAMTGMASLAANPAEFMPSAGTPGGLPANMIGGMLLIYIGSLIFSVVLTNAIFRAVLRPEARGFASLRLGMDELRMLLLCVAFLLVGGIGMLLAQLLLMLIATFLGWVAGEGVAGLVLLVLLLGLLGFSIWVSIRLSLIFPVTFYRRRFSIDAGWELGRGRFWLLFGSYLVVTLILLVLGIAIVWATMGDYFAAIVAAQGDPLQLQAARIDFMQRQSDLPWMTRIVRMVLSAAIGALGLVLGVGVLASAARELLIDSGEDDAQAQDWSEAEI